MTCSSDALAALIACLRGGSVRTDDWAHVIELANRALLTPALFSSLARTGQLDGLPDEVRAYLRLIHDCNRERNLRLRLQLTEALTALNRVGIAPVLLKGAVHLFLAPVERLGCRMTSDLDLGVQAHEVRAARACLLGLGYEDIPETRGMGRPQDVGVLELRQHSTPYEADAVLTKRDKIRAKIPSVTHRALHWIVHDLIKEGDYWRGRIDLRHLHDLAELAGTDEGIDWRSLRAAMPDQAGRNALDTQLLTLHYLFGVSVPSEAKHRRVIRFHHWRRVFAARHPVAGMPLRLLGNLAWGARRLLTTDDLVRRGATDLARRATSTLLESRAGPKL
jgi:hypothetical protein